MLKKLNNWAVCHHFLSLVAFQLEEGRGPGPPDYAYGLMIAVQVDLISTLKFVINKMLKNIYRNTNTKLQQHKELV